MRPIKRKLSRKKVWTDREVGSPWWNTSGHIRLTQSITPHSSPPFISSIWLRVEFERRMNNFSLSIYSFSVSWRTAFLNRDWEERSGPIQLSWWNQSNILDQNIQRQWFSREPCIDYAGLALLQKTVTKPSFWLSAIGHENTVIL